MARGVLKSPKFAIPMTFGARYPKQEDPTSKAEDEATVLLLDNLNAVFDRVSAPRHQEVEGTNSLFRPVVLNVDVTVDENGRIELASDPGSASMAQIIHERDDAVAIAARLQAQKDARTKRARRFVCGSCGDPFWEEYMLHDAVWRQAWPLGEGFLHLSCAELLLGRPLTIDDFKDVPGNDMIRFGYELAARSLRRLDGQE